MGDITNFFCKRLGIDNPWPEDRPDTPTDDDRNCFTTGDCLEDVVEENFIVLELGSWLGASTRFFCDRSTFVIAIDHWLGSPEHQPGGYAENPKIETLYETFIANCYDYRDRLLPLRMNTAEGVALLKAKGIKPHMVYVDADHSYAGCFADIERVTDFGRDVIITGDDFAYEVNAGVKKAVIEFAAAYRYWVVSEGNFWMLVPR
jgi:hypothetical protein